MNTVQQVIAERLDATTVPRADLDEVRRRAGVITRRRRTAIAAAAALVLVAAGGVGAIWRPTASEPPPAGRQPADFSSGLRGFAWANGETWLGGRVFPPRELLPELGPLRQVVHNVTLATPTEYGMFFFGRDSMPRLLGEDGSIEKIDTGPVDPVTAPPRGFVPTAATDSTSLDVAFTAATDRGVEIVVYDPSGRTVVDTITACAGSCADLRLVGFDGGAVVVAEPTGSRILRNAGEWEAVAGPDTTILDVRNGVLLFQGRPPPTWPDDRLVQGRPGWELSLDGQYLLTQNALRPTGGGAARLDLPRPPGTVDTIWAQFDTDGSLLIGAESLGDITSFYVYDCTLPALSCERIDEGAPIPGDLFFVGEARWRLTGAG